MDSTPHQHTDVDPGDTDAVDAAQGLIEALPGLDPSDVADHAARITDLLGQALEQDGEAR